MCAATASLFIEEPQYSFRVMQRPTPILEETICDSGTDHESVVIVCINITLIIFIVMALLINPGFIIVSCVMHIANIVLLVRECTYTPTQDDSP
jgi:hypothetical protein